MILLDTVLAEVIAEPVITLLNVVVDIMPIFMIALISVASFGAGAARITLC